MADTVTTTLGLTKPEVGASEDSWGEKINTNFDLVDDALDGTTAVSLDINGGTIDGAVIGGATPAAITGTAITGTSFATSGDFTFGDNDKAIFGAGSDLQIYSDGASNDYIDSTTSHVLQIRGSDVRLGKYTGETFVRGAADGAVTLYYDNAIKLATTSTGVDITGTLTSDGLTADAPLSTLTGLELTYLNATKAVFSLLPSTGEIRIGGTETNYFPTFYSSGAERMRIDSSGNLLVGTTSLGNADVGVEARANGTLTTTADSQTALFVKRIGSGSNDDGELARFQNADGTVGSIGAKSDDLYINTGDTGIRFNDGNDQIWPVSSSGTSRDAAIDLGASGVRFKDLYLSGGVFLGGTGSSNKLDDYEEGTWTPTIKGGAVTGTGTYGVQQGFYRKVGQLVFVSAYMTWTAHTGTGAFVFVLPFTPNAAGFKYSSMTIGYANSVDWGASNTFPNVHIAPNVAEAYLGYSTNNAAWVQSSLDTAGSIIISGCYSAA